MLFNSIDFVVFFATVVVFYFTISQKFRWVVLLVASCYFYMAFIPWYILILFYLIILDFFLGLKIEKIEDKKRRLRWLWISIFSNIGTLFVFKYFNFFNESFYEFFGMFNVAYPKYYFSLLLPLGLSFHTFQSLSYVIEVYRGNVKAERHIGIYALYVMFFPQLVAGPIERPAHMIPQFREFHQFSFPRLVSGGQRMIWGFFKKIVIADQLALFVNIVYGNPGEFSGPSLVIATVFFAFQIYCDFSGYCDIAIGAAEVLGFKLSENFNSPYFSSSISDFWRRWHMSLSLWFRDYVYFPLGGSLDKEIKTIRNLLITFLLSGLWHGANWTFVIWGLLNGVYLIIGRWKSKFFHGLPRLSFVSVFSTFTLTCFAWIFFRAENLTEAWYIVTSLGSGWGSFSLVDAIYLGRVDTDFFLAILGITVLLFVENIRMHPDFYKKTFFSSSIVRTAGYTTLIFLILALWEGRGTEFIYFQF